MADQASKTEPATPRQRQRARQRGQVARSTELVSAVMLLSVLILVFGMESWTGVHITAFFRDTAGKADMIEVSPMNLPVLVREVIIGLFRILSPFLLASLLVVLLANFLQVGMVFSAHPLNPELSKINPIKGFQRILSMRGLVELVKNLLKLMIIAVVAFSVLRAFAPGLLTLIAMPPTESMDFAISVAWRIAFYSCALLLVLAILDYMYQRFEFEKSIRMSKQEIKDEYKNMEGDPQVKRRIREMGRSIIMSRMMEAMKTADAVITNPTHFAVAVAYDVDWPAPKVLAKGKDYMALRIIRYAEELDIPVYQQPSLARALYDVELDQYIPANLFKAVARVLAHLSRFDQRLRRKLRGLRPAKETTTA